MKMIVRYGAEMGAEPHIRQRSVIEIKEGSHLFLSASILTDDESLKSTLRNGSHPLSRSL